MSQRDPRVALEEMIAYARKAQTFIEGRQRTELDSDEMLAMAVVRALEVVGEAATRVEESTRKLAPEIPWRSIVGMRNLLIHGYDDIDMDIVWHAIRTEVSDLIGELQTLLVLVSEDLSDE